MEQSPLSAQDAQAMHYSIYTPSQDLPAADQRQLGQVYDFWKNQWERVFVELQSTFNPQEFWDFTHITTIHLKDELVAAILLNEFSHQDVDTHDYFRPFSEFSKARLKATKFRRMHSMQYLLTNPAWSARRTGVSFASIIIALATKKQEADGLDGGLAVARDDLKVTQRCADVGFQILNPALLHNVPISCMSCAKPVPHPNGNIRELTDHFWNNRTYVQTKRRKAA